MNSYFITFFMTISFITTCNAGFQEELAAIDQRLTQLEQIHASPMRLSIENESRAHENNQIACQLQAMRASLDWHMSFRQTVVDVEKNNIQQFEIDSQIDAQQPQINAVQKKVNKRKLHLDLEKYKSGQARFVRLHLLACRLVQEQMSAQ